MRVFALLIFGLSMSDHLFGQGKVTIYYDQDWRITTSENFQIRREAGIDFSTIVFNGKFKDYNRENKLIAEGEYVNGVKTGNHKSFFEDGTLRSSVDWKDGDFTINDLKAENAEFTVLNGTGKFKVEYSTGSSTNKAHGILQGEFKNKERVGKWIYTDSLGNPKNEETYSHGNFKRAIVYLKPDLQTQLIKKAIKDSGGTVTPDENSAPVNKLKIILSPYDHIENFDLDKTKYKNLFAFFSQVKESCDSLTNANIRFPGVGGYSSIIAKETRYPAAARRNNIQGTVIIRVIVSKEGVAKSYKILKAGNSTDIFDNEALRVARLLEDKWFPAHKGCVPFESLINLPISFTMTK